jgi:serine/threonine-protein kinase HipA
LLVLQGLLLASAQNCHYGRLILAVGERGHEATLANALTGAASFGLERGQAARLLEDLRARVHARWKSALAGAKISNIDIERFAKCYAEAGKDQWQNGEDQR